VSYTKRQRIAAPPDNCSSHETFAGSLAEHAH
jgi:hypothetical protein